MAKAAGGLDGRLKAVAVRALVAAGKPGAHADGSNLYLRVAGAGAGKWTLRFMIGGRSREMGLGAYDENGKAGLTLAQARVAASGAQQLLREGVDPIEHRNAKAAAAKVVAEVHRFRDAAEAYIEAHEVAWRNPKHRAQWRATLAAHAYPAFGDLDIQAIGTEHVLQCLKPIWTATPETASRLRGRVEVVLDYAKASGWRDGENPARWRGHLSNLLPSSKKIAKVKHHAALPWKEMPAFIAQLRAQRTTSARALEFTILTACRTTEVLEAKWAEVDIEAALWTVPAARMKAGREHRVPLSTAALDVLRAMAGADRTFVFPGQKVGGPMSSMAMLMLLRRMDRTDITTHGFRSTFRDWTEETTSTPHAVAEAALAHSIGNAVEAAYRRGDLLEKRKVLMQAWADYCSRPPAEVVVLREAKQA